MDRPVVRTRFAPSPTGFMHVGGVRTALFAWLIAKQAGGQFILRIEDTDKNREVAGSMEHIMESLRWLGIEWSEGPDIGGVYGPYKQSERLLIYHEWALKLIEAGRAYADPYSAEQVDKFRASAVATKQPFLYRNHRPENPPTWDGSQPLRFKSDPKPYVWNDAVMGKLSTGPEVIDDFILIKSDGYPTYNFCHIIDDYLMQCTHVIRSQEFISSTPKFLNLYEALGVPIPILATLPFVMATDGKKKLGKRDGAKDILEYRSEGYLPEVMINFLASLGWNDGTEQEIFSIDELITHFSLDRVQRSGARFDETRLSWMNGAHIRALTLPNLYQRTTDYWPPSAENYPEEYKHQVLALVQERLKRFDELADLTWFFFKDPGASEVLRELILTETGLEPSVIVDYIDKSVAKIESSTFEIATLHDALYQLCEELATKPGVLFKLLRISVVGGVHAPGLFETMALLKNETTLRRLMSIKNLFS